MRSWFKVQAKTAQRADIAVFDEIGGWGVQAKDFIAELKAIDAPQIDLSINSNGGDVFTALAMFNALAAHPAKVNVKIMGIAASAASLLAMVGDTIDMPENTFLMVHNPWSFAVGNASDMRDTADVLDKIGHTLTATYAARSGKPAEEVQALLDAETWLSAEEAVAAGFADTVSPAMRVKAAFDTEQLPERVRAAFQPKREVVPLASIIAQQAAEAGFAEFAGTWAFDADITDEVSVQAAIGSAREIKALCGLAGKPDMLAAFVRAKASVSDARAKLNAILVQETDQTVIDKVPASGTTQTTAAKANITSASVWAAGSTKKG